MTPRPRPCRSAATRLLTTLIACASAEIAFARPALELIEVRAVQPAAEPPAEPPAERSEVFGGISGLAYDPRSDRWLAVRDHPAIIYELTFPPAAAGRDTPVFARRVASLPGDARDAEAVAPASDGSWFVAFESPATAVRFDHDFRHATELRAARDAGAGLPSNKSWEAAAILPSDPPSLLLISETGLAPTPDDPARIRRARAVLIDPARDAEIARGVYDISPPADFPLGGAGVTEIAPVDARRFLALERTITPTRGFDGVLFLVELTRDDGSLRFTKHRLASLRELGVTNPGNVEAMALGPRHADGSRTLVIINDDNLGAGTPPGTRAIILRLTP